MTEKDFKILISKKQRGLLNKKEEAILFSFEKKMLAKNRKDIFLNEKHKLKIQQDIYSKIIHTKQKTISSGWIKVAGFLIVALTIGSVGWYTSLQSDKVNSKQTVAKILSKEVSYGKKLTFILPDGSRVKLNSGSKIKYPEVFNDSIREVTLSGEAFFEIKEDSLFPFIVKTASLSTRVLGTTFNIKDYEDENEVAVTLATGKISVGVKGEENIILSPSYQLNFNKSTQSLKKQKINLDDFLGWKDGILRFDNEKLSTAVIKLEKWFNVKIKLQNKQYENCSFTGVFKDASLERILENITFVKTNLKYKIISSEEVEISGFCNN
ncbi:FecR family protein [Pseudalgibacter alginicilyticus]|nr:FecR domain-containing protein [Pseudalgibacter alginicilyticus]